MAYGHFAREVHAAWRASGGRWPWGSVVRGRQGLSTLLDYRYQRRYAAKNGQGGLEAIVTASRTICPRSRPAPSQGRRDHETVRT